ncbi:N-6 DNA methylase [Candidatus Micrarchaeota archaeon]|nr:N-6 DNA methylase [Candidatus Micrarchaeota archaeon]
MAISKEEAKKIIAGLVEQFKKDLESGKANKYKEEETKTRYIQPLFEALGWDFSAKADEVSMEEKISGKRVDYGFRINGVPKFYVEAKAVKKDLERKEFAEQAINYSWHKGCPWAVLTDFEGLKIFNAEWKYIDNPYRNLFKDLKYYEYVEKFDDLWLLSKESMKKGELNTVAEKYGKKIKKKPVDKQLFSDLIEWRRKLSKNIVKNNPPRRNFELTDMDIDEAVQRLLDRLIFIRTVEDRGIYIGKKLIEIAREYEQKKRGKIIPELNRLFILYDNQFNSKLFKFGHISEQLNIDNDVMIEILKGLDHTKDHSIYYNFAYINADVLGNMYEQYLGYILKKTAKRAKLEKKHAHRKEMGIYYTPTYIVDYIVKNTVGEYIKTHKPDEIKNIKILDPACGSGSFLIRAFKELDDYWKTKDKNYKQTKLNVESETPISTKIEILKNNIYGVDLDPKAVEIAQLNLLLRAAEKKHLLPTLDKNIKCGNSLIDDLEVAGNRAFKWEDEFEDIMKEGGFDVIIGNPPYVDIKQLDPKIVRYLFDKYPSVENRMNLYSTFVEKGLSLLKDNGYFGFIIPNSILYNKSYSKIRSILLKKTRLKKIIRLPDNIFEGVKIETIILVYQKGHKNNNKVEVYLYPRNVKITTIQKNNKHKIINYNQKNWEGTNPIINIGVNSESKTILNKIESDATPMIKICDFSLGLTPYDKYKGHTPQQIKNKVFHSSTKKNSSFKPLLSGKNIIRYGVFWDKKEYISYGNWLGAPREKRFFTSPRIVVRQIISGKPPRIYAGYTKEELYNTQIAFNILSKDDRKIRIKYILAILNSKLMNYYHKEKYLDPTKNLFQKILIANAKKFPMKIIPINEQNKIITYVDKMLSLNKRLNELGDKNTDEKRILEQEIEKTDKQIDQLVYKLYGLTKKEIEIVEKEVG